MNIEVIATIEDNNNATVSLNFPLSSSFPYVLSILQQAFNNPNLTHFEYIDEDDDQVVVESDNDLKTVFSYYNDLINAALSQNVQVKPLKVNVKSEKTQTITHDSSHLTISLDENNGLYIEKDNVVGSNNSSSKSANCGKFIYTKEDVLLSEQSSASSKNEEVLMDSLSSNSQLNSTISSNGINDEMIYQIGEIGVGASGRVVRALYELTQEMIAIKIIDIDGLSCGPNNDSQETIKNQILRELSVLKWSKSPFIIEYYGAYFVETSIHICTELMDGFSLDRYGIIDEDILGKVLVPIVNGLDYLWSNSIIHRDVKPSNMLINTSGHVKLCDFGISKHLIKSIAKTYTGTMTYMSPERLSGLEYNFTADVWGLGISLGILATGCHPVLVTMESEKSKIQQNSPFLPNTITPTTLLHAINHLELFKPIKILNSKDSHTNETSQLLTDFIGHCLQVSPDDRFSQNTIKQHKFYLSNLGNFHSLLSHWVYTNSI